MLVSNTEMSLISNSKKIRLFLCLPWNSIKVVIVTEHSKVSIFDEVFNKKKKIYIYNGTVLSPTKKLSFYHLQHNDKVFVLNSTEEISKFFENSQQLEDTFNMYAMNIQQGRDEVVSKAIIDPRYKMELARLNDLRLMKIEFKRKRPYKPIDTHEPQRSSPIETIIPEEPKSISCDPLPLFTELASVY